MAGTGGDAGSGMMMGTLVWVGTFVTIFALLVSFMGSIQPTNLFRDQTYSNSDIAYFDQTTLATYTFYNTSESGSAYNIVPQTYGYKLDYPSVHVMSATASCQGGWNNMSFDGEGTTVHLYAYSHCAASGSVAYNETTILESDAFLLWSYSGIWDSHHALISVKDVINKAIDYKTYKQSQITVWIDHVYTVFFTFPGGTDPQQAILDQGGYSISLGRSALDAASEKNQQGMLNTLLSILTFQFDSGNQVVNLMISVPIATAYIFIGFWGITRLIGAFMI